jgi:hypothetical protein
MVEIEIDEFEVDDNFRDKSQWAEQRAVSLKLPLQNIDTVRESNPIPSRHASEPLTAKPTNMLATSGADYDSPRRQSETADRFNYSQVKNFSSGTEEGISAGCLYIYQIALDSLQSTQKCTAYFPNSRT